MSCTDAIFDVYIFKLKDDIKVEILRYYVRTYKF